MEAYLGPLIELRGRVLAEAGTPVSGARLTLERVQCESCAPATAVSVSTDATCSPRATSICSSARSPVAAPGFARTTAPADELRGRAARARLRLRRGLELTGRVVDFETGEVWPGGGRRIPRRPKRKLRRARPADAGLRRAPVRADGRCRLWARIPSAEVEGHAPVRFPLARGTALEGTLRDAEGRAVAGVEVRVAGPALDPGARNAPDAERPEPLRALPAGWRFELDSDAPWNPVRTDEAGRFRFEGLPPWSRLGLVADDGRSRYCELELEPWAGPGNRRAPT
jgi:hypothetical protein